MTKNKSLVTQVDETVVKLNALLLKLAAQDIHFDLELTVVDGTDVVKRMPCTTEMTY